MKFSCSIPFLLTLALSAAFCSVRWMALLWTAAAVHEGGHLLALRCMGVRLQRMCFRLSGPVLEYAGRLSYGQEALLALAGPGANGVLCLACAAINRLEPSLYWPLLCGCSLVLGLFNLLPALPLDGGRALQSLLLYALPDRGEQVLRGIGLFSGALLVLSGVFVPGLRGNWTLPAAGCVIFFALPGKGLYTFRKKRYNNSSS